MYPTSPVDNVMVQLQKTFEDEITFDSGVTLYKATQFNPEWNVTVTGKVVSIPRRISKRLDNRGLEVGCRVGDTLLFSYHVVFDMEQRENDTPIHNNRFYHRGEYYWKVDYSNVIGWIRDGVLTPAQGYIFCSELPPKGEEKIGLIYLPDMVAKGSFKGRAKVEAIGENKTHEPKLSIKKGDIVVYPERHAHKYEIEGKNYIVLDQCRTMAIEQN